MHLLVLAPNWLGDAVMVLPALADLRRHHAAARLTVAARPAVAPLFAMVPGVDAVLTLPGRSGRGRFDWRPEARLIGEGGFDTAVLFPNSFGSAWMLRQAGVPERWGAATDFRRPLLTRAVRRPGGRLHQAAYYQAIVAALGIASGPCFAQVVPPATAVAALPAAPYVVLAPGAAYGTAKQWPPDRFAALADHLLDRGFAVVLVGSQADAATCAYIVSRVSTGGATGRGLIDLSGHTSLGELAAVLARAAAVVSNDSGAMHLAGAVGAPVVAVFGATNERRTSPLTAGPGHPAPAIVSAAAFCRPCLLRECPIDHRCMTRISPAMVAEAVSRVTRSGVTS
jgi:heptosyltransferase-2